MDTKSDRWEYQKVPKEEYTLLFIKFEDQDLQYSKIETTPELGNTYNLVFESIDKEDLKTLINSLD